MSGDILLELCGVRAGYGAIEVLHGVDLTVERGTVVGVLGPNGAGKSTMLRVASAAHPVTAGDLVIAGRRVNGVPADRLARRGVCLVPEGRGVFPNLTVREHFVMCTYRGVRRAEVESLAFSRFPRLAARKDSLAGTLSGGEQQQLALARALTTRPSVLLLDELSMGLAPMLVDEMYTAVRELAAEGVAVLVAEQFASAVLAVADRVAVMANGRIERVGPPSEIRPHLASAYLGDSHGHEHA